MSVKKKGLGRNNLSFLLGQMPEVSIEVDAASETAVAIPGSTQDFSTEALASEGLSEGISSSKDGQLKYLPLDKIERSPFQPRLEFEQSALEELASSIKRQGLIQPIVVRQKALGRYELVAGERRWRAAQIAQLSSIPALIRELADLDVVALALIENIQRENLNPMEEAQSLLRLQQEFGLTHEQIAEMVGKSRATVTNLIRLMNLDERVRAMVLHDELEMGHARALLSLDAARQMLAAQEVASKRLSVRETERLVRELLNKTVRKKKESSQHNLDPHIYQVQEKISLRLGARVAIQHATESGKGKIMIHYHSLDELQGILDSLE